MARGHWVFTDGSNIDVQVGAGYVIPERNTALPTKVKGPQRVNRAEMTAQLAALEDIPQDETISVYKDNKCSIQDNKKWIVYPGRFPKHKHEDMLFSICTKLANRTGHTTIYKIPAHVGQAGNEAAYTQAKTGAKVTQGVDTRGTDECLAQTNIHPVFEDNRLTTPKTQL